MFYPLFDADQAGTRQPSQLLAADLDSGYVSANRALLGRGEELRQLFSPGQLAELYGDGGEMYWLTGDITQDRTPEIRTYLMEELDVEEVIPESITGRLSGTFLEAQSDDWIVQLYEFLSGQQAIIRRLTDFRLTTPLLRLMDGTHVSLREKKVFLPGEVETDFPTVHRSVCSSPGALSFLRALGLRESDLVDDVMRNVLPKYQSEDRRVDDAEYEEDFGRILRAYATVSIKQRESLLEGVSEVQVRQIEGRDTREFGGEGSVLTRASRDRLPHG